MIGQTERISVKDIVMEQPAGNAFPLEYGLKLTNEFWQKLSHDTLQGGTISSYYYHYSTLKILDYEGSKSLKPSEPTMEEINYMLEHEEDALSILADVSILFPNIVKHQITEKKWVYFGYLFDKAVRNDRNNESMEIAFNIKLIDPERLDSNFINVGETYVANILEDIGHRDKYYPYLMSTAYFKFLFPGKLENGFNDEDWEKMGNEIHDFSNTYAPDFVAWYLRSAKLALSDHIEMTDDGLRVDASNTHVWSKFLPEPTLAVPLVKRF